MKTKWQKSQFKKPGIKKPLIFMRGLNKFTSRSSEHIITSL
jgi:hypothetical protein